MSVDLEATRPAGPERHRPQAGPPVAQTGVPPRRAIGDLSFEDRLKLLLPRALYFPYKIGKETRRREPELAVLRDLVRPRSTAIDIGANRGIYSYALGAIAQRVEAFEPNPKLADFARSAARPNTRLHQVALSNRRGSASFFVPRSRAGNEEHLLGSLVKPGQAGDVATIEVEMTTLDSFAFDDVSFIKIDVEGAELDVLEGARQTVERHRPRLVVELLTKGRGDALAGIRRIEAMLGYRSWLLQDRAWHPAAAAIERLPHIQSNNVVFTPNGDAPARLA